MARKGTRIDRLRSEIRRLDGEILRLAQQRVVLAEKVGRWKLEHGLPVRDYEMEQQVLALAESRCKRHGLDPTLGREMVRALIAGAVKVQEDLHERRYTGGTKRVSIIGGRGQMGRWFAQYLYTRGHLVTIHDTAGRLRGFRNTTRIERAVDDAEIIFMAVPLSVGQRVYRRVIERRPTGTIADLFSLKTPVLGEIQRALDMGLSVSSFHPLFGPDVYLLSDRILLLAPTGHRRADREIASLFKGTSLEIQRVPVEDHDKVIGLALGLSHAINIVFAEALARSGLTGKDLDRVATTTYSKQAQTASEVAAENPRLYHDIQHLNQYSPQVYDLFEEALRTFRKAAQRRHPAAFEAMMQRGRQFFEG